MWTRKELKQRAKEALKRNYWKAVLVSMLLLILGDGWTPAATAGGSSNSGSSDSSKYEAQVYVNEVGTDAASRSIAASASRGLEQMDAVVVIASAAAFIIIILIAFAVILAAEILVINPLMIGSRRFMLKCVDDKGNVSEIGYAFDNSYVNCVKAMFYRELHVFLWALLFIIPGIYKKYQYYMVEYILAENPALPYKEVLKLSKEMMQGHKWNTFVLDLSFIFWHMLGMLTCGILEILYIQPYTKLTRASLYRAIYKNSLQEISIGADER